MGAWQTLLGNVTHGKFSTRQFVILTNILGWSRLLPSLFTLTLSIGKPPDPFLCHSDAIHSAQGSENKIMSTLETEHNYSLTVTLD